MSMKFCNECHNLFKTEPVDGVLYNICGKCGNKVKCRDDDKNKL